MAKRLFVAATEQHSGKTTISVCLMHLARKRFERVGFIKPVGQQYVRIGELDVDKDTALMATTYGLQADLPLMSPVVAREGFTKDVLDGVVRTEDLTTRILESLAELERRHDFIIIEGTGHGGVGAVMGVSNARVASLCQAPVLIVVKGGIGSAVDAVSLNLPLYRKEQADVRFVLANKLLPDKRASSLHYMSKALHSEAVEVLGGLDYSAVLASPTLAQLAKYLDTPLRGALDDGSRIAHRIHLGAASTERCVDLLRHATLIVTTSSRDELIVTLSSLYAIPEYKDKICGLIVAGVGPISPPTQRILDASGIPYLRPIRSTGEVFALVNDYVAKTGPEDQEKIEWMQAHSERCIDFDALLAGL
ncbi:MAG: AAA family ATPase [Acidobacteriota bacterium]